MTNLLESNMTYSFGYKKKTLLLGVAIPASCEGYDSKSQGLVSYRFHTKARGIRSGYLYFVKCSQEIEPGTTWNKLNERSERVLNPGSPDLKASGLFTGLHCLQKTPVCQTSKFFSSLLGKYSPPLWKIIKLCQNE